MQARIPSTRLKRGARIALIGLSCLLAVYLGLVVLGGGLGPRLDDTFAWPANDLLLFAHRGAVVGVPENSRASLAEAINLGFKGVEIDVRKTRDNELALFHGNTGRTMLGVDRQFRDLTLSEVREHNLRFEGKETTNSVPTLHDVFQEFGTNLHFYLDMKNKGFKDADDIVALIDRFGLYDRTILASVNPLFVAYVEHNYPRVNTALERFDYFQVWLYRLTPKRWKPDYLSGMARKVTAGHVQWLKEQNLLSKRIVYDADGTNYGWALNFGITKAIVDYDPAAHSTVLSKR